jgi:hypothetical protein
MSAGFTSAYHIAVTPRAIFIQAVGEALGGAEQAAAIYDNAQHAAATGLSAFTNLRYALSGQFPRILGPISKNAGDFLNSDGSGLPTWQQLFGSLSFCSCSECRSVYGAAAYFVDLMQFLGNSGQTAGKTPLDILLSRRPDLPYIKLNCENANTTLPYVDLVNEILEGFVALNGTLDRSIAHNTPQDATPDELSVTPEYTNDVAYNAHLSQAIFPPTLPYDRWLTTVRIYLEFLGSSLHEIMKTFQRGANPALINSGTPSAVALACEYLEISNAECRILTGSDYYGNPPSVVHQLYEYYGFSSPATAAGPWEQAAAIVTVFLDRIKTDYQTLVDLLKTRFLNSAQNILIETQGDPCDLEQMMVVDVSNPPWQLLRDTSLDRMHRFVRLSAKIGQTVRDLDKIITALQANDIDQPLLISLAAAEELRATLGIQLLPMLGFWNDIDTDGRDSLYVSLFQNKTVLNPPDPAFALRYRAPLKIPPTLSFPNPLFPNLTYDPTIHYLIVNYWPGTGMLVGADEATQLLALSSDPNYTAAINWFASTGSIISLPGYSLPNLPSAILPSFLNFDAVAGEISFVGAMTDGQRAQLNFSTDSTYQTAVSDLYEMRSLSGAELAAVTSATPAILSDHVNAILAALRITAEDLDSIRAYVGLADPPSGPAARLNLANLSAVYRYAVLAQSLAISVGDLISVILLMGIDPFQRQDPATLHTSGIDPTKRQSPAATLAFVKVVQAAQTSPFSVAQLNYLYRHVFDPNGAIAPRPEDLQASLAALQAGLAKIARDAAVANDPKGDLLRKKLALLLGVRLADAAMGLIDGTGIYSTPLAALPNIDFSSLPTIAITYDAAAQTLRIAGPMTSAAKAALQALSPDLAYQAALADLYQQPRDFIDANLTSILQVTSAEAVANLIDVGSPAPTSADKIAYVAAKLAPHLQRIQGESLIKQTLSDALTLDPKLTDLLLTTILNSRIFPAPAKAMADFIALVGDGMSAAYYPTVDLSGPAAIIRVDPTIDFDWGFGTPGGPITARPFSARWTGWVMPQYSETYVFYVRAGDGFRLWVNDPGTPLIDRWMDQVPIEASQSIALSAGQVYWIKLEYYAHASGAVAELSWSSPSTPKAIIPQTQLFSGSGFTSLAGTLNTYMLLSKSALLANTFQMTPNDFGYLFQHGADFSGADPQDPTNPAKSVPFDPNLLPLDPTAFKPAMFDQWRRLSAVIRLRNALPGGDARLLNIFATAASGGAPGSTRSPILTATGWNAADFDFLFGPAGFALNDSDFVNEIGKGAIGLVDLEACLTLVARIGVSAQQLFKWANFGTTPPAEESVARDVQNTVKAKYDDSSWVSIGKPLNDKIRQNSRDALVAYILANAVGWGLMAPQGGAVTTADQLYEFFLIDVEMSPCMLTSRIVQANAAIQLFVQRVLMNLEAQVSPDSIDHTGWEWMKNFRVWQAGRLVFLHPENVILPELRDDKSPFFTEFESELLQSDITAESVQKAYLNYLRKLDGIARIDVRGLYYQYDGGAASTADGISDATNDVLHVFARTKEIPQVYYYRRLRHFSEYVADEGSGAIWTPWEQVDADIEGDHLIPVVWDHRLYLFWPIFKQTSDPNSQNTSVPQQQQGMSGFTPAPVQTTLEIRLAWSEYKDGSWTPKRVMPDPPLSLQQPPYYPRSTEWFTFQADPDSNDNLVIRVYYDIGWPVGTSEVDFGIANFTFTGCNGGVALAPSDLAADQTIPANIPFNTEVDGMSIGEYYDPYDPSSASLTLNSFGSEFRVLWWEPSPENMTPYQPYWLVFPQQMFPNFDIPYFCPFFHLDSQRTYFVIWTASGATRAVADARHAAPAHSPVELSSLHAPVLTEDIFAPAPGAAGQGAPSRIARSTPNAGMARFASTGLLASQPSSTSLNANVERLAGSLAGLGNASGGASWGSMEVRFSTFFHPHACTFIKTLNRYGFPQLMSLPTQEITNDNGVLSGFTVASNPVTLELILSPGIAVAQGHLFESTASITLPVPPPPAPYLYYNSQAGFYYTQNSSPNTQGDALIASIAYALTGPWSSIGYTVFENQYLPGPSVAPETYPLENVDFSWRGAYSIYNWELFFHIPLLAAIRLSGNRKFEDAEKWFRYIFDPTTNSSDSSPQRYWRFLPFYECAAWDEIAGQIQNLLYPPQPGPIGTPPALCGRDILDQIAAWKEDPFNPHLIARMRPVAYRMKVVMAYMDHRLAWGDYLFAQNTREFINEAELHYVVVREMLGDRPVAISDPVAAPDYNYNELVAYYGIDKWSNALVQMENDFPLVAQSSVSGGAGLGSILTAAMTAPYFCFPPNDQLLGYWDTVDDRLYKIRHCMNIQGVVQQLPLFAPPISPALLVQAKALGVDISSILSNIDAPTPYYRFSFMVQKALELCDQVRSLGTAFLSVLEKNDAEALSLLRATQETNLLQTMRQMKQSQIDEANATASALNASRSVTAARQAYYQMLLQYQSVYEQQQQQNQNSAVSNLQSGEFSTNLAAELAGSPDYSFGVAGAGGSPLSTISFGGGQLGAAAGFIARIDDVNSSIASSQASLNAMLAGWERRGQEWNFQAEATSLELTQIDQQINAANIRVQIVQDDLSNHDLQIQNAQAVQDFLTTKFTQTELYAWMVDQMSTVFSQSYQMAYDLANRAQAAFRFERGVPDASYITFGYWDSLKKGLMAGERLYVDLKRMDLAYLEQNVREYEITKALSLVLFDPWALITLKRTGRCLVTIPESLFDMDYPGHYFRRLKSVSLTISCVTGPYTSVNCTVTLLNSKVRTDRTASSVQDFTNDAHFVSNYAATQSIATTTAQNDSGLFEVNFHDERYLPFEGAGCISNWQIDMPLDCNAFDFDTITDVIINLRYTARYGGDNLRDLARKAATLPPRPQQPPADPVLAFPDQSNLQRLFSVHHEFAGEWYKFLQPPDTAASQSIQIVLGIERFPYQYRGKKIRISGIELFLIFKGLHDPATFTTNGTPLGDYQAGSPLKLSLTPPGGSALTAPLTSVATMFAGTPFASLQLTGGPTGLGTWTLTAQDSDIANIAQSLYFKVTSGGNDYYHLNPDVLEDVFVLCRYSTAP